MARPTSKRSFWDRELQVVASSSFESTRLLGLLILLASLVMIALSGWLASQAQAKGWLFARSQTLSVATLAELQTLEPARMLRLEEWQTAAPLFETLVQVGERPGEFEPGLAQSWLVEEGGKVWTFTLREGVFFHNGQRLTAQAVVQWLEHLCGGERPNPYLWSQFPYIAASLGGKRPLLERVQAVDERRVRFTLRRPLADFLEVLAAPAWGVVSPASYQEGGFVPIGTGPYQLVEWRPGQRLSLRLFSGYWREKPQIERLLLLSLPPAQLRVRELRRGNVDIALDLPLEQIERLEREGRIKIQTGPSRGLVAVAPNCSHRPFSDLRGRLALQYALPKREIYRRFCLERGQVGGDIFSPLSWARSKHLKSPEYSPHKAKRLFDRVYGSQQGPRHLSLIYRRYNSLLEEPQRLANFLSQRLGELGLAVSNYPLEEEEYNLALRSGQYDLVLRLESWPWVDPATELNLSWAWAPGLNRLYNPANYYSNRLSLLGEGARFVGLQAEREAAYAEVQEKLAQDGVALNLAWTEIYHGCGLKVANLVSNRWGLLDLGAVVVEE